jgi:selenide,water dikinase
VQVLSTLEPYGHPWVDTNVGPLDDAALLRPPSGSPLVFTVDFITPIVDEPETFGAIAAANALSDVYAMGGEPQAALAVCGFPKDRLPTEVLQQIFRGGRDKAAEAGCAIVGGHTVKDAELKYGLCVIGTVDPARALRQTNAEIGDALVLTKPIGFGIAAQAIKQQRLPERDAAHVVSLMTTLNKAAKDAALAAGAHAATDVTGFGLLGHLHHLLLGARAAARLRAAAVPVLGYARDLARDGFIPGGSRDNLAYVAPHCAWNDVDEVDRLLLCDAQTSGGLLLAVPPDGVGTLVAELRRRRVASHAIIGEITAGEPGHMEVVAGA